MSYIRDMIGLYLSMIFLILLLYVILPKVADLVSTNSLSGLLFALIILLVFLSFMSAIYKTFFK